MKKLLIIVPYRDRPEHLKSFLEKTPKYFREQNIEFDIIICELENIGCWNAAKGADLVPARRTGDTARPHFRRRTLGADSTRQQLDRAHRDRSLATDGHQHRVDPRDQCAAVPRWPGTHGHDRLLRDVGVVPARCAALACPHVEDADLPRAVDLVHRGRSRCTAHHGVVLLFDHASALPTSGNGHQRSGRRVHRLYVVLGRLHG